MSFLPGMFPAGAAAGATELTTLTQVGLGTSDADDGVITSSVTIQDGDLLVVSARSVTTDPSGFTAATVEGGTTGAGIWYKLANGTEGTTVIGGSGKGATNNLFVFRGNIPITDVTVGSPNYQATDGNPAAQIVTASSGTPPLIVLGYYESSGDVDPRTMNPAKDGEVNAVPEHYLAYKIYNSSPADVTVDMDDEGDDNELGSCYLACS